jgi:hypothetical protein
LTFFFDESPSLSFEHLLVASKIYKQKWLPEASHIPTRFFLREGFGVIQRILRIVFLREGFGDGLLTAGDETVCQKKKINLSSFHKLSSFQASKLPSFQSFKRSIFQASNCRDIRRLTSPVAFYSNPSLTVKPAPRMKQAGLVAVAYIMGTRIGETTSVRRSCGSGPSPFLFFFLDPFFL